MKRSGVRRPARGFFWLRNLSDFLVGSMRTAEGFDPEEYLRQLADQGFTHVTINGLAAPRPFESGPPGDVYSWFYDYSPDLDQFVDSTLLKGVYPDSYLRANLARLSRLASVALDHGLVPGFHINSPRSMPESFWQRHPYLRGARIDHPRESFLPRYTLAMAHPVVQQHYRELVRRMMATIPEIGFFHVWTNDSGAGFEFTSSLYAGRNGGPYLIREWKSDEEIERKAAENVLTYYRLLRDEAKAVNRKFRLVCDLGPFYKERVHIIKGLGNGIDAGAFGYFEGPRTKNEASSLRKVGAFIHHKVDAMENNVIGLPFPGLVYERLTALYRKGERHVLTSTPPHTLAPYDINGEVIRELQKNPREKLRNILRSAAVRWAGEERGGRLLKAWEFSDAAVRSFPRDIPYSTFAFPWFRLWVRPFVPNIDAIPESDRAYYERYLLATFNNPTRVDLNNDMMWNFLSVARAGQRKAAVDRRVLPPLQKGIDLLTEGGQGGAEVFRDTAMRLRGGKAFFTTMRNVAAWIEGVHGYLQARTARDKAAYRQKTTAMVDSELANARELLQLWNEGSAGWLPVSAEMESLHMYGRNFGELVRKKIALMEEHRNDEPFIDPDYMWRMPRASTLNG